jgi:hypothetical protein
LDLFLEFLEVVELTHHSEDIMLCVDLLNFYIHHLAPDYKYAMIQLQVVVVVRFQALQFMKSLDSFLPAGVGLLRYDILDELLAYD